jgi:thiol:disulfide interchange protein DsbA
MGMTMRALRYFALPALMLCALGALGTARAQTETWELGKHYFQIEPPQPGTLGDKIVVTEVFSYGCPACNLAYPHIDALRKKLPANAVMDFVPASFNPSEDWPMFQRAYLTAKALGIADRAHDAMFDAVWKTEQLAILDKSSGRLKQPLPSLEDAARFYSQYGVSVADFLATANSFTINTRIKQADAYIKACGVDSTPTLVIGGKYRLTVKSAGDWDKFERLALELVQRVANGK